jgi:hypothetical protein
MRIISFIAAFTLATVVYADVTPISSGVAEATSLQTRSLRGEVHEVRFRPHRPVDSMDISGDESDSNAATSDQTPTRRKRKNPENAQDARSTDNGVGAASTPDQPSTGTRPKIRRHNGQLNLNRYNAGKNTDIPPTPRNSFRRRGSDSSMIIEGSDSDTSLDTPGLPQRAPRRGGLTASMMTEGFSSVKLFNMNGPVLQPRNPFR